MDNVIAEFRVRAHDLGPAAYFDLGEVATLAEEARAFLITCPHCGRQWLVPDRAVKAVTLAAGAHRRRCHDRSAAERRAANSRDEARWRRRRPSYPVVNDPDHPGVAGAFVLALEPSPAEPPMSDFAEALFGT